MKKQSAAKVGHPPKNRSIFGVLPWDSGRPVNTLVSVSDVVSLMKFSLGFYSSSQLQLCCEGARSALIFICATTKRGCPGFAFFAKACPERSRRAGHHGRRKPGPAGRVHFKPKLKSGGQECPPHTSQHGANDVPLITIPQWLVYLGHHAMLQSTDRIKEFRENRENRENRGRN
jgi:hypothetical protein